MDFSLNDHQKLIRDTVRQFMEAEVRPSVKQRDREERFPAEEIKKLAELGCCGMMIPEEWGGPGLKSRRKSICAGWRLEKFSARFV